MFPSQTHYNQLISRKDSIESSLVSIGKHCKGISEYLTAFYGLFDKTAQWFHIANGIKELNYDGITYDSSFSYCRPAYEYETARQKLFQKLVEEITLFTYIYSGLEAVINDLDIPDCPSRRGKINAAAYSLKNEGASNQIDLCMYNELIQLLDEMVQITFEKPFKISKALESDCYTKASVGLYGLYKIRNMIMHGEFFFPEPLDYSSLYPFQPEILKCSSRLALLSVQMLLRINIEPESKFHINNSSILEIDEIVIDYDEVVVSSMEYLTNLHVQNYSFKIL